MHRYIDPTLNLSIFYPTTAGALLRASRLPDSDSDSFFLQEVDVRQTRLGRAGLEQSVKGSRHCAAGDSSQVATRNFFTPAQEHGGKCG